MKCLGLFNFIFFGCAQFKSLFRNLFKKQDENKICVYRVATKVVKTTDEKIKFPHNGLPQFLYEKMKQHLENEALIFAPTGETILTSLLLSESIRVSNFLTDRKIKPGDLITIFSENTLQVPPAFIGACFSGAIVASFDPEMDSEDVLHLLSLLRPQMMFVSAAQKEGMQRLRMQLKIIFEMYVLEDIVRFSSGGVIGDFIPHQPNSLDSVAVVVFSSGITGVPKAVDVSHKYAMYHANRPRISTYSDFSPLCLHISVLLFLSSINFGITRIIIPKFSPKHFWKFVDTYKIKDLYLNYFELHTLLEQKPNLKHVPEYIAIHGDIITDNDLVQVEDLLPTTRIVYEYHKAELGTVFRTESQYCKVNKLSVGLPKSGFQYKIVDLENHTNLGFNQRGELRIKTEYTFSGYHNEKWTSQWDQQGFLKTGDIAFYDKDFCFYVIDRLEYTFKSKEKRVFPGVLEYIIRSHPDVEMASVLGVPDARKIYHPIAVVVKKKDGEVTARRLLKFVNKAVGVHEKITAALFVDSLPITFSRKVNHRNLYTQQLFET